ncbi:MAG: hypothetical protein IAF58_15030, partial [Leptolyngbya sp.]|nr:hypothetical protein [Candidatus Melainabacteria bacterium]
MDTRLSISNRIFSISFSEFVAMLQEFNELVERSFGTPCSLEIRAMDQMKMFSTRMFHDDTMDFIDECNRKAVFFKTADLSAFPNSVFDAAIYIEAIIAPKDRQLSHPYAFAHAEFKGARPSQGTFYLQPQD